MADDGDAKVLAFRQSRPLDADDDLDPEVEAALAERLRQSVEGPMEFTMHEVVACPGALARLCLVEGGASAPPPSAPDAG